MENLPLLDTDWWVTGGESWQTEQACDVTIVSHQSDWKHCWNNCKQLHPCYLQTPKDDEFQESQAGENTGVLVSSLRMAAIAWQRGGYGCVACLAKQYKNSMDCWSYWTSNFYGITMMKHNIWHEKQVISATTKQKSYWLGNCLFPHPESSLRILKSFQDFLFWAALGRGEGGNRQLPLVVSAYLTATWATIPSQTHIGEAWCTAKVLPLKCLHPLVWVPIEGAIDPG